MGHKTSYPVGEVAEREFTRVYGTVEEFQDLESPCVLLRELGLDLHADRQRIQDDHKTDVQIIPNSNFEIEKYELKVVKSASKYQGHSYDQKQMSNTDLESRSKKRFQQTAAVQRDLYKKPAPSEDGLVSRLFKNLFKKEEPKKQPNKKHNIHRHASQKQHTRTRSVQNRRRKHNYQKTRTQTEK